MPNFHLMVQTTTRQTTSFSIAIKVISKPQILNLQRKNAMTFHHVHLLWIVVEVAIIFVIAQKAKRSLTHTVVLSFMKKVKNYLFYEILLVKLRIGSFI